MFRKITEHVGHHRTAFVVLHTPRNSTYQLTTQNVSRKRPNYWKSSYILHMNNIFSARAHIYRLIDEKETKTMATTAGWAYSQRRYVYTCMADRRPKHRGPTKQHAEHIKIVKLFSYTRWVSTVNICSWTPDVCVCGWDRVREREREGSLGTINEVKVDLLR